MSREHTNFNWVFEPWTFLSEKEAKTLLAAAREGAALAATQGRKAPVRG